MSLLRKAIFQPDICEWLQSNRQQCAIIRKNRHKLEKGMLGYLSDARDFFRSSKSDETGKELTNSAENKVKDSAPKSSALDQFYESEELIKRMKWKKVTWDEEADYPSFSNRVLNNQDMFKSIRAFSFMSLHVVKDPLTSSQVNISRGEKVVEPGSVSNLFLMERDAKNVQPYFPSKVKDRLDPFCIDWNSGCVKILDTAAPQELLTFLTTVAPRLQAVQLKMEEQQERQTRDVENVRVRVGATLKFNDYNTSFWDDPKRLRDSNYVNPDELEQFLSGMLNSAFLYRWFLKGTEIKVLPPGSAYYADVENNMVLIPANFSDYNWLSAHSRFQSFENIINSFRRFWWFWFSVSIVVVGDVELL